MKVLFLSFTCEGIGVAMVTNIINQLQESFPLRHAAGSFEISITKWLRAACEARVERVGDREEKERDWEERVRDACYKNPLLSIVRKFLIGCAVMSKLLACILACIYSERQTR